MIRWRCATVLLLLFTLAARADECGDAVRDYNAILSKLGDALEQYRACIADSKGMDGCAKPFAALRSAQSQFASVVAIYSKQCEVPLR